MRVKVVKKRYVKKGVEYTEYLVRIPIEIARRTGLDKIDYVDVYMEDTGKIVIVPVKQ